MIIPWMKGFLKWDQVPVTWMFLLLNLFIFLATTEATKPVMSDFSNADQLVFTGKLFEQYQNPGMKELPALEKSQWMIRGGQALKNPRFIEHAPTYEFFGDQIAIQTWKEKIRKYRNQVQEKATTVFGLRSSGGSPLNWVTYQFMHAGWMHLLGNMLMFLIFGAALETAIGGLGLCLAYLFSGFAGAALFSFLSPETLSPMIGASGSLSGVMALYAAFEKKKRVAFFYFVSPMPGYFGWIYLPTVLIFPLCFLSDIAGYLSTPPEIGTGIAYTAHIGGALFGAFIGWTLKNFRHSLWARWFFQH